MPGRTTEALRKDVDAVNRKKMWTVAAISLTAVVVGAVAYQVINSNDSSEESPDTAAQSEERQKAIQDGDPPTTTVSTTSTTLPEVQEPVVEEEPEEEVTEDPETGTEVDDSTEDPPTTPVSTTSTTLPEVQEPVVEEEPQEEVTEDPTTGTEVDDSTEDPPTTPVSTTSTTLPEVQEPVVEEEPEEEVTEDPETGTEVDDSGDWVLHIPPNPIWLEEKRAALAFYRNCCQSSEDVEIMKRMWNQLVGDDCDANVSGTCNGMAVGQMYSMNSIRACPRGWSLDGTSWNDPLYDGLMCSHPDHNEYEYGQAYYPTDEADPQGVHKDHWASNSG